MFGDLFQPMHLLVIAVIAILIFGPRKLPELGKGLGEGLRGFKEGIKGMSDVKTETPPPAATETRTASAPAAQVPPSNTISPETK
ncbi:MAG: Sec-independent protein translocase subunit TatA/TatB [Acidobacteriaceae bacterium]